MIDNLLGGNDDDEGETQAESDDAEIGGLFDDPGDGDLDGDGNPGGDDGLDDIRGDDATFDDEGLDGAGNATNDEMSNHIDELENEIASLSSAVETVKSENEQLSESLDDVDENIRKLLEVYEMVTRGVNPFVDDDEIGDSFGGAGGGGGGGSGDTMGLFGDGDDEDDTDETGIDESVANTDADDFFDADLDDATGDDGDGDGEPLDDEADDLDADIEAGSDATGENVAAPDDGNDVDDGSGGKTFEDLKSEYDSADAGLDDGSETAESSGGSLDAGDGVGEANTATGTAGEKPYLEELPAGYAAEMAVMDWLEFLVEEAGADGAARTIAYYEAIEWISETAADSLRSFLEGFGEGLDIDPDAEPRSPLTVSHHDASLRYISRVADPSMAMAAFDRGGQTAVGRRPTTAPAADEHSSANGRRTKRPRGTDESTGGRRVESDGGLRTHVDDDRWAIDPASDGDEFIWGDGR